MKKYYIAYGSNLNLSQMAFRCPTAKVVGTGLLPNYQLQFCTVATIIPKNGAYVPIAVWEIDELCELSLDRYEGFPTLYRKEYIDVKVRETTYNAMIYIMNSSIPHPPTQKYFDTIKQGYYDTGLDDEYLFSALNKSKAEITYAD